MILTDKEIRKLCLENSQKPLIAPFKEEYLQAASYDVSMSGNIRRFGSSIQTIRLTDQDVIDEMYEEYNLSEKGTYVLKPGEYILVQLNEKICIPQNIIAHLRPRTRFTRAGIMITDQHCNPTYEGYLQVGLYNVSPNAIELVPDLKIGQLVFEQLASIPSEEKWYCNKKDAAYQNESEFIGAKFGLNELSPQARRLYEMIISGEL